MKLSNLILLAVPSSTLCFSLSNNQLTSITHALALLTLSSFPSTTTAYAIPFSSASSPSSSSLSSFVTNFLAAHLVLRRQEDAANATQPLNGTHHHHHHHNGTHNGTDHDTCAPAGSIAFVNVDALNVTTGPAAPCKVHGNGTHADHLNKTKEAFE